MFDKVGLAISIIALIVTILSFGLDMVTFLTEMQEKEDSDDESSEE